MVKRNNIPRGKINGWTTRKLLNLYDQNKLRKVKAAKKLSLQNASLLPLCWICQLKSWFPMKGRGGGKRKEKEKGVQKGELGGERRKW